MHIRVAPLAALSRCRVGPLSVIVETRHDVPGLGLVKVLCFSVVYYAFDIFLHQNELLEGVTSNNV